MIRTSVVRLVSVAAFGLLGFGCGNDGAAPRGSRSLASHDTPELDLVPIGTYQTGVFDDGAAEIVAYDAATQRLFVVNGAAATIDVLDISDPTDPVLAFQIDVSTTVAPTAKKANSVAVSPLGGAIAAAIENVDKQAPGFVAFFDTNGVLKSVVQAGALPDMLTFTPDGNTVLVANEGEPSDDYSVDPEGSISVIDVSGGIAAVTQAHVSTADFTAFNGQSLDSSIRIYGPGASVAQDLEPEYITVSEDSGTAWVTLQENNALAIVDVSTAQVTSLQGLGFKDHSRSGHGMDASNEDGAINITPWPTRGMYQPDSIASFRRWGRTFLVLANEGDSRDYPAFSEEERVKDVILDPTVFPNAAQLQQPENLGRLKISTVNGDTDGDGDFDQLFSYGGRSLSVRLASGALVSDTGDELEEITADALPTEFNSTNDENGSFDDRSDDKGPEPEGVVVADVCVEEDDDECEETRPLAFLGLERIGGVAVYDLSRPWRPRFVRYVNTRDFSGVAALGTAGDLGPEGLTFISRQDSPIDAQLLVVSNEVSGSTTIFRIEVEDDD